MIEDIVEYTNETAVKESKHLHPTLKQVEKKMKGFDESLVMYVYHYLNGREDEAQSYLNEWNEEQEEIHKSFYKKNDLQEIKSNDNTEENDDANKQYATSNAVNNATE